ncbi:MAG: LysR family transcriptional regulator, partial [Oribacterium sp.]|nr:LysR family transcriptional regulator [Oribacterium sp.]
MTDKDIEILKDLSETHNITKTAERLYTTQSALTKRVQSIEQELGCQLFIRSKKGLVLTPVNEAILPYVKKIQSNLETIRNLAGNPEGELSGTLKVGVAVNYARHKLAEILEQYIEKYPKVDIQLSAKRSPDLYKELISGEINAAI